MLINVLASGSTGNAYLIDDGKSKLLLECGIPYMELQRKSGFEIPLVSGCLISHSHNDHSKAVNEVMAVGIECYMSEETSNEINLKSTHRLNIIKERELFKVGTFNILPLEMKHDVKCLGFVIHSTQTNEKVFFATDTYYIEYLINDIDYLMVEANYDIEILNKRIANGNVNGVAKERLIRSHQSIDTLLTWLSKTDLSKVKRIYLMHLSDGSSNADNFKERVEKLTGKPVTICG